MRLSHVVRDSVRVISGPILSKLLSRFYEKDVNSCYEFWPKKELIFKVFAKDFRAFITMCSSFLFSVVYKHTVKPNIYES